MSFKSDSSFGSRMSSTMLKHSNPFYSSHDSQPTNSSSDETFFSSSSSTVTADEYDIECMQSMIFDEEIDETVGTESDTSVTFDINCLKKKRQSLGERLNGSDDDSFGELFDLEYGLTHLRRNTIKDEDSIQLPRTLFVGNLSPQINERILEEMFSTFGDVIRVVLYNDMTSTNPYAYIQFADYESARCGRLTINGIYWLGQQLKVCWAFDSNETDNHFHTNNGFVVFVDFLSSYTEDQDLRQAFEPFGQIFHWSIARNSETNRSKGFGFVYFVEKSEAENAINTMNGQLIHCSLISENGLCIGERSSQSLDFDSVYCESSESNQTVCCFGLQTRLCIQIIRILFSPFGSIEDIRINEEKGCALISYGRKRFAAQAIVSTHQLKIMGQSLSCWWAEEPEQQQEYEDYCEDNDFYYFDDNMDGYFEDTIEGHSASCHFDSQSDSQFGSENSTSLSDEVFLQH